MVKLALQIRANFENIKELRTSGQDFRWYLKFSCTNCGDVSKKWNYVSLDHSAGIQKGSGVNHFLCKCKFCLRENSMTILENTIATFVVDDNDDYKTIVVFDCRGIQAYDFSPRKGWIVKTVNNGKEFTDVDLSEGEWVDYCDKTNQPVSIYEIQHRFSTV